MAAESSTTASSSRSGGASADSYIGSLISLTSKSEIRYEGILYNINTEESSIGLRNVRSFGTEGRKKDGPQVPPSDKIYEYILFRGSDIKDLQVKASPPVQTTPPSHYPQPANPPTSLPTAPTGSLTDLGSHSAQLGLLGPLSKGYYGAPNGLPHLPQQSLLRPPPGLSVPPPMQQMQFSGFNSSLPTAASGLPNSNLPDYHSSLVPNIASSSRIPSVASKPSPVPGPAALVQQNISQPVTSVAATSDSFLNETPTPSLITPGQLLQSGPSTASAPQILQTTQKDVEVVQVSPKPLSEPSVPVVTEAQPPILPLPPNSRAHKNESARTWTNLMGFSGFHEAKGCKQGVVEEDLGIPRISRPVTRFTEDFDFTAMNEKFKKDEVWGHLGKSNRSQSKDNEGNGSDSDEEDPQDARMILNCLRLMSRHLENIQGIVVAEEVVDLVEAVVDFAGHTMEEGMVDTAMWVGALGEVCRPMLPRAIHLYCY
ncbi:hypothetical protein DH2020_032238 [Rehmannia glutinosa]|uniref:Uncharacterized protein n=1 Tax=Rehmannia glutinosa TaxID=99300 RepID=A0ABR0VJQ3_REHGL